MLSQSNFDRCNTCHQFSSIRGKLLCPRCAQRCHQPDDGKAQTYLCILDPRGAKFSGIKQTFLSRWYGHGGYSARVEQVVALFAPAQYDSYITFQNDLMTKRRENTAPGQEAADLVLNERRLYIPLYPKYTCTQFLPKDEAKGNQIHWHQQQQEVLRQEKLSGQKQPQRLPADTAINKPAEPCTDPNCELCTWIKDGIPQTVQGRTGESGLAHYLSYDPEVALRTGIKSKTRNYRICVMCRVIVGSTQWQGSATGATCPIGKGHDSLLIEKDDLCDVVIPHRHAISPSYLIVCSSEV